MDKLKEEFARLHDAEADLFKKRYEEYIDNPYVSAFTYGRKKIDEVVQKALRGRSGSAQLLDVGCGSGFNLYQHRENGFSCIGVDFSWEMLRVCGQVSPGTPLISGDAEALPFLSNTFSIVTCIEVIRYLGDPVVALQEIYRVLEPGGVCVLTAAPRYSSHGYAFINWLNYRFRFSRTIKSRQSFETTAQIHEKMRQVGFKNICLDACFLGPFRWLEKFTVMQLDHILKLYEPIDKRISNLPFLRELSNHFVVWGFK